MSDSDDELARAIAASLAESSTSHTRSDMIDIDDSDANADEEARFQAELQRALEESKASHPTMSTDNAESSSPSPFLSERAQLEKERLERQKRLRRGVDDGRDDGEEDARPRKRQNISSSSSASRTNGHSVSATASSSRAESSSNSSTTPIMDQLFWEGELRQTATKHAYPRRDGKPTWRLTEILGKKSDISFAILSSYSLDIAWIYQFFDPTVPVIMVAQTGATDEASVKNVLPNWIKTTPILPGGRGCMHMKFMLLFYKSDRRVRVVVSTANLVDFDYRDIENTAWLQDIPIRSSPIPNDPKADNDFPTVFQRVLKAVNVSPALSIHRQTHPTIPLQSITDLRCKWDWSKVKVQLIPSIAGKHEGWPKVILTGHPRLMKAVRDVGMRLSKGERGRELVLECQGSSIGQYTTQWMNAFYHSACGESAEDWLDDSKASRSKLPYPPVKILYPTLSTVQASKLGEPGGGTIFCRRDQWKAPNFPRTMFHDSKSKAGGVLMHSKMIIGTTRASSKGKFKQSRLSFDSGSDTEDDDEIQIVEKAIGWVYVGSHNFTPSAWGNMSGSAFNPILNIQNYELGVLFPVKEEQEVDRVACFERPPRKYSTEDLPWMQEESVVLSAH